MAALLGAQQPTLLDRVLELPSGEKLNVTVSPMYPAWDLRAVFEDSDIVAEVIIRAASSALSGDLRHVATTYNASVERVFFQRHQGAPLPGVALTTLRVRHFGGDVELAGHVVDVRDTSLPPFQIGADVILFLKQSPADQAAYDIVDGPYGVFTIVGEQVHTFLPGGRPFPFAQADLLTADGLRGAIQSIASDHR